MSRQVWVRGRTLAVVLAIQAALLALAPFAPAATASAVATPEAGQTSLQSNTTLLPVVATAGDKDLGQVEPGAGNWHTWVLASGSQIVPPAPPGMKATREEIKTLRQLAKARNDTVMEEIAFWNSGAPAYRWNEMAVSEMATRGLNTLIAWRHLALVHAAMSDATVAAWHAKYLFDRPRPSDLDDELDVAIDVPNSPSYPAEHAVTAGAASEVLAYIFPDRAAYFRERAIEAGNVFANAGVNYPSDIEAGLALGRQVAALVIERGKSDASDLPWTGTVPSEPGKWTGANPVLPQAANWKTWVLVSGDELRPPAPLAYDSPELAAEMNELRDFQRTPRTNTLAFFWEYGAGGARNYWFWNQQLSSKLFEYRLSDNPPQAARDYALQSIAVYDAVVACWDAKYAYWAIRPFQLDSEFKTLFATPNHPSYPSAHSCLSTASAGILGYLFPQGADGFNALANEASESRIWVGLHFRSDINAGTLLGQQVVGKVIAVAGGDEPAANGARTGDGAKGIRASESELPTGGAIASSEYREIIAAKR